MAAPPKPYACDPARSRGRQFDEPPSESRSAFRRDCDRVIHSTAFRRLKHKTQVFVFHGRTVCVVGGGLPFLRRLESVRRSVRRPKELTAVSLTLGVPAG